MIPAASQVTTPPEAKPMIATAAMTIESMFFSAFRR